MKDVAGNELQIGDKVVTVVQHYRDLVIAEVVGFTAKMAKVKTDSKQMTRAEHRQGYTLKDPHSVCLVITRDEVARDIAEAGKHTPPG